MKLVTALHLGTGIAVVVLGLVAFVWGIRRARRPVPPSARNEAVWVQLVALAQTLVLACGLLGLVLLAEGGAHPKDPLHVRVYGPFMVFAMLAAWGFRTSDRRWNIRVMAVACLFIALLGVRAVTTGY